jgi:hypothetical protein
MYEMVDSVTQHRRCVKSGHIDLVEHLARVLVSFILCPPINHTII